MTPDRKQPSFQQLVEAVSDFAIYMLDPDGRVMSWNPAAERIKGWRREEVEGQSFRRFFTLEDQRAGLPERRWHTLRHTFGTHAALFGVNPWRLQSWMGHKRIDETMIYVHVAESHMRELPEVIRACFSEPDPDARIIKMLGARGKNLPKTEALESESRRESAG